MSKDINVDARQPADQSMWTLHDDRVFPVEPKARDVARQIYSTVKDLPIISPHGHVPIEWLSRNEPFKDPTALLITPDHYVTRIMHANGVSLKDLGVGQANFTTDQSRAAFRTLAKHWSDYLGTSVRYWLDCELSAVFGVNGPLTPENADEIYDHINELLRSIEYHPRALFERFNIEVLTTTDDPVSDLSEHAALAADSSFAGRVLPTFRPDRYLEPARPQWPSLVQDLGNAAGVDTTTYSGFHRAMRDRRLYFKDHGAISSDHSHRDLGSQRLSEKEASNIFALAMSQKATPEQCLALRRHLFNDQALLAQDDGLVMTVHPAVSRDHDAVGAQAYGADIGGDIPLAVEFTEHLRPLLNEYGNNADYHFVLFTIDETVYTREIAPLAGYYRSVYIGDPWWFIDAPDAMVRFRESVTEISGFSRQAGFVDDTRAFCSIPARHDLSRRTISAYLARLVSQYRISQEDALQVARRLIQDNPRHVFKI